MTIKQANKMYWKGIQETGGRRLRHERLAYMTE
jgi:hypothetical protein